MATTEHFRQVADRYRDRIYSFSFYYLGRGEDAEDVTQEVLIRLWRHVDTVDESKLGAWVTRVTRNACIDLVRKKMSYRNVVAHEGFDLAVARAESAEPAPDAQLESEDRRERVTQAIALLPEPFRSILVLREIQQLSYNEITEAVGMPLNTVKVYIHRGRRKLREHLMETCSHGA